MIAMNKKIIYLLFMVSMLLSACGSGEELPPPPLPTGTISSFKFFQDGYYQVIVPDWQDSGILDADSIFTIQQDGQFIMVNRYQNLPEIFAEQFLKYIEEDQNAYLVQQKQLDG